MIAIQFIVFGLPQSQGSIKSFVPKGSSKAVLTSDNSKLKPWRQDVGWLAKEAMNKAGMRLCERPGAIRLEAVFYFPRPKAQKKAIFKTTKPDQDKLLRALCDALSGICYEDDAQVARSCVEKCFVNLSESPRTEVTVSVLDSTDYRR